MRGNHQAIGRQCILQQAYWQDPFSSELGTSGRVEGMMTRLYALEVTVVRLNGRNRRSTQLVNRNLCRSSLKEECDDPIGAVVERQRRLTSPVETCQDGIQSDMMRPGESSPAGIGQRNPLEKLGSLS